LAGTRAYADVVRHALHRALASAPEDYESGGPARGRHSPRIVVIFGAEHGFTGAFNRRIVELIDPRAHEARLVAGTRAATLFHERRIAVDWATPMATNVGAVTGTARRIADELHRRLRAGTTGSIEMVYARYAGIGRSEILRETLFPVSENVADAAGVPPLLNLPPARLAELLIEEYLFGALAHAGMESVAGENAARLTSMQFARHNIEDKRVELERGERTLRQEEITVEMLDVVTGAVAMTG